MQGLHFEQARRISSNKKYYNRCHARHSRRRGCVLFIALFRIHQKIANENELIRRIRDHVYGSLNSKNKPSKLNINRKNLGQNATQIYCIITHLPFIFHDKRRQLRDVWLIMESLLKINRIIFSSTINESNISDLSENTKIHLSGPELIRLFGVPLTPKHNLAHTIRM